MQADSRRRVCIIDSNEELFPGRDSLLAWPTGRTECRPEKTKGASDTGEIKRFWGMGDIQESFLGRCDEGIFKSIFIMPKWE